MNTGYVLAVKVTPKSGISLIGPFDNEEDAKDYKEYYLPMVFSVEVTTVESPEVAAVALRLLFSAYVVALAPFQESVRTYLRRRGKPFNAK